MRCSRKRLRAAGLLLEALEVRALLSATYYVAPGGNDNNPGTQAAPYATIQAVVWKLHAGDTLNVLPGTYAGFVVGWDDPGQGPYGSLIGTATAPIVIQAQGAPGSVIINARNAKTADGIDIENSSFVTVQGFSVLNPFNASTGASNGTITRAGIRVVVSNDVTVRNNVADHNGTWGIFTGFAQDVTIEGNTTTNSQTQHGIYVSNSADNPIVRNNVSYNNYSCGIHMNSDASQGGDGIITNALIEGNILHDNGVGGGSAINMDGVQNSRVQNNLIYNNHASGISLFDIDGAEGAKNNVVVNNTIVMPANSRWALNIVDGSTGNIVYNNILLNVTKGAINIDAASLPGFVSDDNAVVNLFSPDDGDTFQTLAQWRAATGQDGHSFLATAGQLFVNSAANDYHLAAGSAAIDAGTAMAGGAAAPGTSLDNPRPIGANWDIGAYERDTVAPTAALSTVPITTTGNPAYTFSVTYADNIAVAAATADSNDVRVTGPAYSQMATLMSTAVKANGIVATYQIVAPAGGVWTMGTYTASVQAGQVADTTGNFVPGGVLGTLQNGAFSIGIAGGGELSLGEVEMTEPTPDVPILVTPEPVMALPRPVQGASVTPPKSYLRISVPFRTFWQHGRMDEAMSTTRLWDFI